MAKKRVFVAVNLPDDIRRDLEKKIEKIRGQFGEEVRFLTPENWHLTISFLGYQTDDDIYRINRAVEETAGAFDSPLIRFEKIVYGPVGKTPRMIWLTGAEETSRQLGEIKTGLEKRLLDAGIRFEEEHRRYNAHLTMARFSAVGRRSLPGLDESFGREFHASSLDLMESHLRRGGAQYEPLSQFDFGGEKS